MKLLVISDTHGYLSNARDVLNRIGKYMSGVIHLGDHSYDAEDLKTEYPDLPFYIVRGNNDFGSKAPNTATLSLNGKRLVLTHGHLQQVYWNYDSLYYWAEEQGADVVLFGHTHRPVNDNKGRILVFNPGSISMPRGVPQPTFGILEIAKNGMVYGSIMEYIDSHTFLRKG